MVMTEATIVSFAIPEDNDRLEMFRDQNDLSEWEMKEATGMVTYTNKKTYFVY